MLSPLSFPVRRRSSPALSQLRSWHKRAAVAFRGRQEIAANDHLSSLQAFPDTTPLMSDRLSADSLDVDPSFFCPG